MSASQKSTLGEELRLEILRAVARQGPMSLFISTINAAIVYVILDGLAQPVYLWCWISAVLAFVALRLVMVFWFWRLPETASYRTWSALYVTLVFCNGLCWGLLPLFEVFHDEEWVQGFIVFVLVSISAGGALSLYVMLSAAIPWFLTTLLPLIVVLAAGSEFQHTAKALIATLFLLMLIRTAYTLNAQLRRSIRLEVENRELFDFLIDVRKQ